MIKSTKDPLVSVLIPAYNAEKYLPTTLESILGQTYKNTEIIICDDTSTDSTGLIAKKYAKKDKRVRYVRNETNLYIAGNRNKLISLAKGEFIVWMDADDISRLDRIEKQLRLMQSDSRIGICGGWLSVFREDPGKPQYIREYPIDDTALKRMIFRFVPVAQPAAMVRSAVLKDVGEYDLTMPPAEDLDILFRIGLKYKFANVGEVVIDYRDHPASATYKKLKTMELRTVHLRYKYMKCSEYEVKLFDRIYNSVHWLSVWIIPTKLKIRIFQLVRQRWAR